MQIHKPTESFENLILTFGGHVVDSGVVIESNVNTVIRLNIREVGKIYDQLLAVGNTSDETASVTIKNVCYTFPRKMAIQLIRICAQVWQDYEIGDQEFLPEEEWTEAYLLSL